MRKALPALVVVFALAFGLGALAVAPAQAAGGSCFYACDCAGQVIWCCGSGCKVATWPTPWQCPQVYNC